MTATATPSRRRDHRRRAARPAPTTHAPARTSSRVLAYLVDVAAVLAVVGAGRLWRDSTALTAILVMETVAVLIISTAVTGRSPGALLTSTATVRSGTSSAPGLRGAVIRGLVLVALSATGVGGIITLALGREGRDWVDRLAGTEGVDLRSNATRKPQTRLVNMPGNSSEVDDAVPAPSSRALAWQGPAAPSATRASSSFAAPSLSAPSPSPSASPSASASRVAAPSPATPSPRSPAASSPTSFTAPSLSAPSPAAPVPSSPSAISSPRTFPKDEDEPRVADAPPPPMPQPVRAAKAQGPSASSAKEAAVAVPVAVSPAAAAPTAAATSAVTPTAGHPTTAAPTAAAPTAVTPTAGHPTTAAPTAAARRWIVIDSGQREPVDTVLIVGRAPVSSDPTDRLVTVSDTTRSLSRTHLRITPSERGVWVEDMFSANGTLVRRADGLTRPLPGGQRIELPAGMTLIIGERSITIR